MQRKYKATDLCFKTNKTRIRNKIVKLIRTFKIFCGPGEWNGQENEKK